MTTWTIGPATVTRVEEQLGLGSLPPEAFFADFDRAAFEKHFHWMVPGHYLPEHGRTVSSIHSWLIRIGGRTILLDSCCGNHKERTWNKRFHQLNTPFLDRLRAAGAAPEDIDIVLCTHLHVDHIGWNTMLRDGRWVPTFPNARYVFSRIENDYWDPSKSARLNADPGRRCAYEDSVLPVIAAGQAVLVDGDHAIDDSLLIEPAPGHTPGHVVLKLAAGGDRGLFCGDVIHHPVQVYEHHWNTRFCEIPVQARESRRRVLEYCAEHGATLFPTHFGAPFATRIRSVGDGFAPAFVAK